MIRRNFRILIILAIVAVMLGYCWTVIIGSEIIATWRHYLGLLLFAGICLAFFKDSRITIISTGIYLLLASFNIIAFTPSIVTNSLQIGPASIPGLQIISLGLFILYFLLNMDNIINMYLDYKGVKKQH